MRRLIRADLRRILAKPTFWICPGIAFLLFLYSLLSDPVEFDSYYASLDITLRYVIPFLIAIPVFTCVYSDELRSGAMLTAIGRGLSRTRCVLAKFLDTVLLSVGLCVFLLALDQLTFARWSVVLTRLQTLRIFSAWSACCLQLLGHCAFAALFVYLSWNASVGLTAALLSISFSRLILENLQTWTRFPTYDATLLGQADMVRSQFDAGSPWVLHLVFVLLWYVLLLVLAALIFRRKELEL